MKLSRIPVLTVVVGSLAAAACGAVGGSNTAAKVGGQELTVPALAEVLNVGQVPLETEVVRSVAELWINFQLAGMAAARSDTVSDVNEMNAGLWSAIDNMRVRTLYDQISEGWADDSSVSAEERYNSGEIMAARHILIQVGQDMPADQAAAAKAKAEAILKEATPANFVRLAARSEEPGAGERGGDLPVFTPGQMVPEFEAGVLATTPGEISKELVQSSFGYHIIYRKPFSEVASEVEGLAKQRTMVVAESLYLTGLENGASVKLAGDAASVVKEIAGNPLKFAKSNKSVADFKGGKLTASRLADWVAAYPPQQQLRPRLLTAPDSVATAFVQQIVRNELLLRTADSAGIAPDTAELANLHLVFRNNLTMAWNIMGVEPASLSDSASSQSEKEALAGRRVADYFNKLVRNEAQFADVAYPVARALQSKYSFSLNDAAIERAIEEAKKLRESGDSTMSIPDMSMPEQAPDTTVPPSN